MGITNRVIVGTSVSRLEAADPNRVSIGFSNTHASAILYIGDSTEVSADIGFPLEPKTTTYFTADDRPDAVWYGISDTASTDIRVIVQRRKQ